MTESAAALSERAAELRRAFDRSFAEPAQADRPATIDFISVKLADDIHAIRLAEIAGLFTDVVITPCPSPFREFRGIAGFRGMLTPVYDLAALLGYPMSTARWVALAKGKALALAFDVFDGHFRVEPSVVAPRQGADLTRHAHEIVSHAGDAFSIVDVSSVLAAISKRIASHTSSME